MFKKYEPSYPGLIFEDNSELRKANLLRTKEENQRLIQLKKDFEERQRQIKEIENEQIKQKYNEYKQLSVIDQENHFRQNRKLYDYNVNQEFIHKDYAKKDSLLRRSFKDQFIDDLNNKKEMEYNNNIKQRNDNIFRHMKEYEQYIIKKEVNQPFQPNAIHVPFSNEIKAESRKVDPSDFLSLQKAPKSPMKNLKKLDDFYNKKIADSHFGEKNGLKYSYSSLPLSTVTTSRNGINNSSPKNETNLPYASNIHNESLSKSMNFYNSTNQNNKQIRYLIQTQDNSFIAKMIVKMRSLGIEGMINLYHQLVNKDKQKNRTIEYYDFRGIIISIYKLDFNFDDCKQFIQSKGTHINLHKISIKDFISKLSLFNDNRKSVVDQVIQKLFDRNQIIDFNTNLLAYLNERFSTLVAQNDERSSRIRDFTNYAHEFFLLNYSQTSVNSFDFSVFLICFSMIFDNDNDYIGYIKFIFNLLDQ